MFNKISATWGLMGDSWEILKQDKELLLFPLISGLCCLLAMGSFLVPAALNDVWQPPTQDAPVAQQVAYYGALLGLYFVNYFIMTFFNVGIIACASIRMAGGNPTLGDGFRAAISRVHLIAGWALLAATVGVVLRVIEDRSEKIGRFVAGLLGMAWTVTTFLVVPTIVMENASPLKALRQSTALLRKTWGNQLVSNFSFGVVFFLLSLPVLALMGLGVFFITDAKVALGLSCIAVGIVAIIVLSLVQSALQSIFQAALYHHAAGTPRPTGRRGFSPILMDDAFYTKG